MKNGLISAAIRSIFYCKECFRVLIFFINHSPASHQYFSDEQLRREGDQAATRPRTTVMGIPPCRMFHKRTRPVPIAAASGRDPARHCVFPAFEIKLEVSADSLVEAYSSSAQPYSVWRVQHQQTFFQPSFPGIELKKVHPFQSMSPPTPARFAFSADTPIASGSISIPMIVSGLLRSRGLALPCAADIPRSLSEMKATSGTKNPGQAREQSAGKSKPPLSEKCRNRTSRR